jgi:hypothetical protein
VSRSAEMMPRMNVTDYCYVLLEKVLVALIKWWLWLQLKNIC